MSSSQPSIVPNKKLIDGKEIPVLGLGTWKVIETRGGFEVCQAVKDAIDVGYRHIDGALVYGNEKEVGDAVGAKIEEGVVTREDLFITGKLWSTFHRADLVVPSLKQTLADLRTSYVDLYLVHWPMAFKECTPQEKTPHAELFPKKPDGKFIYSDVDYLETWTAMEECVTLGLAKSIGVSNFNSEQLERLLSQCKIKPVMNQVECNPHLSQRKLVEFCQSRDIAVTAYSPFGSPDRPWAKPEDPKILEEPKLIEIGKKYGKSPAQVVIRWLIQRDIVAIPKSVTKERIAQNFEVFDFTLSGEDMEVIYSLECGGRALLVEWYNDHKYYPFHIEF